MATVAIILGASLGANTTSASIAAPGAYGFGPLPQTLDQALQTTFEVYGTFGTSAFASVQIETSMDSLLTADSASIWQSWSNLLFAPGANISANTSLMESVNANFAKMRVVVTGGDAGTSLTVRAM